MTSTKGLFASGINYILRDIKDNEEMYQTGTEYLERVQAKLSGHNKAKHERQIAKIKNDLSKIKENIKKHKRELKYYVEYFGYTKDDFKRLNLHPATDEEIERVVNAVLEKVNPKDVILSEAVLGEDLNGETVTRSFKLYKNVLW